MATERNYTPIPDKNLQGIPQGIETHGMPEDYASRIGELYNDLTNNEAKHVLEVLAEILNGNKPYMFRAGGTGRTPRSFILTKFRNELIGKLIKSMDKSVLHASTYNALLDEFIENGGYSISMKSWAKPNAHVSGDLAASFTVDRHPNYLFYAVGDGASPIASVNEMHPRVRDKTHNLAELWSAYVQRQFFGVSDMPMLPEHAAILDEYVQSSVASITAQQLLNNMDTLEGHIPLVALFQQLQSNLFDFYSQIFGEEYATNIPPNSLPSGVLGIGYTNTQTGECYIAKCGDIDVYKYPIHAFSVTYTINKTINKRMSERLSDDPVGPYDQAINLMSPGRLDRKFVLEAANYRVPRTGNLAGNVPVSVQKIPKFDMDVGDQLMMCTDGARIDDEHLFNHFFDHFKLGCLRLPAEKAKNGLPAEPYFRNEPIAHIYCVNKPHKRPDDATTLIVKRGNALI